MMSNGNRLLEVRHLKTSFFTTEGEIRAVDDVSYYVNRGEIVAIVGESGCGKSVTQMSILQLVQSPPGKILDGEVIFDGRDILQYGPASKEIRSVRGKEIAVIFQEPMTSLNPVLTIGTQLSEVIMVHGGLDKKSAWKKGEEALNTVGIPEPEQRMRSYPFELSGGMRQRVMIATAVACDSKLIIADEPTTALDVTTQAQVMELLTDLIRKNHKSMVLITHNLGLVSRYASRIYVMYAGKIIESGTTEQLLTAPSHPYTIGLLNSVPKLEDRTDAELVPIPGAPPRLNRPNEHCAFMPRCTYCCDMCRDNPFPPMQAVDGEEHFVACYRRLEHNADE